MSSHFNFFTIYENTPVDE